MFAPRYSQGAIHVANRSQRVLDGVMDRRPLPRGKPDPTKLQHGSGSRHLDLIGRVRAREDRSGGPPPAKCGSTSAVIRGSGGFAKAPERGLRSRPEI